MAKLLEIQVLKNSINSKTGEDNNKGFSNSKIRFWH